MAAVVLLITGGKSERRKELVIFGTSLRSCIKCVGINHSNEEEEKGVSIDE